MDDFKIALKHFSSGFSDPLYENEICLNLNQKMICILFQPAHLLPAMDHFCLANSQKVATDLGQKEAWVKLCKHKEEDERGKKTSK